MNSLDKKRFPQSSPGIIVFQNKWLSDNQSSTHLGTHAHMRGVEGLNVINDPKCNKVLTVINSSVTNYSNYSNKRRPQISTAFGEFSKRRGAYSGKYGTKRYYYGYKRRIFGEKI